MVYCPADSNTVRNCHGTARGWCVAIFGADLVNTYLLYILDFQSKEKLTAIPSWSRFHDHRNYSIPCGGRNCSWTIISCKRTVKFVQRMKDHLSTLPCICIVFFGCHHYSDTGRPSSKRTMSEIILSTIQRTIWPVHRKACHKRLHVHRSLCPFDSKPLSNRDPLRDDH